MPVMPKDQCVEYGCKKPSIPHSVYCEVHAPPGKVKTQTRKNANDAYKHRSWESVRIAQLSGNPLCQCCLNSGLVRSATVVDHVFPWRKIGKHAFMRNIFQSLCPPCHSVKTGLEQKGVFRYYEKDKTIDLSVNDYTYYVTNMKG